MKKQELIEKYEYELKLLRLQFGEIFKTKVYEELLDYLKQLDEPQKPVVPQFVDDYIKHAKEKDWDLQDLFEFVGDEDRGELREWFYDGCNQETLALTWIFGYEVKEEQRYLVKMKGMNEDFEVLKLDKIRDSWYLGNDTEYSYTKTAHTRKELEEAGFGEVFNSPLFEVEEVEG